MTHASYSSENIKYLAYDSLDHRNEVLGYDYLIKHDNQTQYNNKYFTRAEHTYNVNNHFKVDTTRKAILDNPNTYPNIYDDNIIPGRDNIRSANRYRNWETLKSSAVPSTAGEYNTYTPHDKREVGSKVRDTYWVADLNGQLFDRKLSLSAKEQPYANFYRRQGLVSLITKDMIPTNDAYTKRIVP